MTVRNSSRPIARVFRATAAPGCRDELLQRFHSSSAALVNSKVGCLKYRILEPVDALAPEVVFESIWRDLDAVKVAFGDAWQQSHLPEGYSALMTAYSGRRRLNPYRDLPHAQGWDDVPGLGRDHFDRRSADQQKKRLVKRLTDLGYAVEIKPLAA